MSSAHSSTPSCSRSTRSILAAMRSLWVATRAALPSPRTRREEFGEDDVGGGLVEIAGGLVGEDQRRAVGERAGDGDALLLAARKLARAVGRAARRGRACRAAPRPARCASARVGAADQLREDDILERGEIGQQMVELVDEAERVAAQRVRPSSSSVAASSPAIRIEPSKPPSSSPTAWSRVDLPEPDGPEQATISPGRPSRSTPRSTSMRDVRPARSCASGRATSSTLTHSAAPAPDRCSPRCQRRDTAWRGSSAPAPSATIAATSNGSVSDGSSVRKRTDGSHRFWPVTQLDEIDHRLAEEEEDRAEDQRRRAMPSTPMVRPTVMKIFIIAARRRAHRAQDGDVAGLGADQHDQRGEDVERRDQDDDATARRTSPPARPGAPRTGPSSSTASR